MKALLNEFVQTSLFLLNHIWQTVVVGSVIVLPILSNVTLIVYFAAFDDYRALFGIPAMFIMNVCFIMIFRKLLRCKWFRKLFYAEVQ